MAARALRVRVIAPLLVVLIGLAAAFATTPARAAAPSCDVLLGLPGVLRVPAEPVRVTLADLNHDGILDLVVSTSGGWSQGYYYTISVMLGLGGGVFTSPVYFPAGFGPMDAAAGDFDGDGTLDLAVSAWGRNMVAILHGNGDGTFGAPRFFDGGEGPHGLVAADFNHDGILDLAVASSSTASVGVLLGLGSGGVGNGTFASPVFYQLAGRSQGVSVADLNGDGNLDLVATAGASGIAVLMGHGDGTFSPPISDAAGAAPSQITIRDLNADGIPDLLVSGSSGVAFLKGLGGGAFGSPTIYGAGSINANSTVVADLNGDGIQDFAVSNPGDGSGDGLVQVFLGQSTGGVPDGTFVPHSSYRVSNGCLGIAASDLNGDGRPDVVVAGSGTNAVDVLLGVCGAAGPTCDFVFAPPTLRAMAARPNHLTLADLNQDGIPDLIVSAPDGLSGAPVTTISVMIGAGGGAFAPPVNYTVGSRPEEAVAGDFDGDGQLDLAVTDLQSNDVAILHGNGDGTFGAPQFFPAGSSPHGLVAADFNHDGVLDLAVASSGAASVSVLMGQHNPPVFRSNWVGNGTFAAPVTYPVADVSQSISVADLDGDGNPDLVATANSSGVAALMGHGDGTFSSARTFPAGTQPSQITIRDLNADGIPDLLVSNSDSGGIAFLKGLGGGAFGPPTIYGLSSLPNGLTFGINASSTVIADFNGDGIADFAVLDMGTGGKDGQVAIFLGQSTGGLPNATFALSSSTTAPSNCHGMVSSDLNGDGQPDLVLAGYGTGVLDFLLGSCRSTPPPPGPPPLPPGSPRLVSVRDVPDDQGGHVFLRWTASSFDVPRIASITGYRVWRRLPPEAARSAARQQGPAAPSPSATLRSRARADDPTRATLDYWEAIATLPAEQLAGYGYDAPTVQDSMAGSNPYTAFFVSALTANAAVFYESNVDSGYSVDNLAPPTPAPFAVTYAPTGNQLHWPASPAPDLLQFRLYRGSTVDFVPTAASLVITTRDTSYADAAGEVCYKLEAVDVHGNQSRFAVVSPQQPEADIASVSSVQATAGRIRITWSSPGNAGMVATVYRRTATTDWFAMGAVWADGAGTIRFEDGSVRSGERYGYRLGILDGGTKVYVAETWVTAEPPALALAGARPNPASGSALQVDFTLSTAEPARLELFDVSGRRVVAREVGPLGPGPHTVDLAAGSRVPAGVYIIRFSQGSGVKTARVAVLN